MAVTYSGWDDQANEATTDFDSTATGGSGTITANAASVKNGTNGFEIALTGSGDTAYGVFSTNPANETAVVAELWFDPNSITMATNDNFPIHVAYGDSVGGTTLSFRIEMQYTGSAYQLRVLYSNDSGGFSVTSWSTISDAYHHLRVVWVRASGVGANDGILYFYIDGALDASATGLDTDLRDIDQFRWGSDAGVDAGTSGSYYMDDCQWSDGLSSTFTPSAIALKITVPTITYSLANTRVLVAQFRDYSMNAETKREYSLDAPHRDYVLVAHEPPEPKG